MRVIIEQTDKYTLYHHTGMTRFRGCECFKDCNCHNNFVPTYYDYYTVSKTVNRRRTTHHNNLEDARERINFINSLVDTKNPKYKR